MLMCVPIEKKHKIFDPWANCGAVQLNIDFVSS